jgi:hypothetical protein
MKVRKSAWHYWLYNFGFEQCAWRPETSNLCSYFWRTMWGLLKTLIVVAVAGALLTLGGVGFYRYPLEMFIAIAAVAALITILHYGERRKYRRIASAHPPGLLRSYIKARKDKVCPLIEFVE